MALQNILPPLDPGQIPNPGGSSALNPESWQSALTKIEANFVALYGRSPSNSGRRILLSAPGVNLNSVGDTIIPVQLPAGFTRFLVAAVYVDHASISLTTAAAALYTAAAAGGVAVVAPGALAAITATADATNANALAMTVVDSLTRSFTLAGQPNLYFRNTTAQGAAATADVTIEIVPLP